MIAASSKFNLLFQHASSSLLVIRCHNYRHEDWRPGNQLRNQSYLTLIHLFTLRAPATQSLPNSSSATTSKRLSYCGHGSSLRNHHAKLMMGFSFSVAVYFPDIPVTHHRRLPHFFFEAVNSASLPSSSFISSATFISIIPLIRIEPPYPPSFSFFCSMLSSFNHP
jgi:hypothetical protein